MYAKQPIQAVKRAINFGRRHLEDMMVIRQLANHAYHRRLIEHARHLPSLGSQDAQIVEQLHRNGLVITSCESLKIDATALFLDAAYSLKQRLTLEPIEMDSGKSLAIAPPALVNDYPAAFRWGLHPKLLQIVENYLGLPVAYHGMYFRRDFSNSKLVKSKFWHRDMEDYRSLKIVVYLNDISDDSGGPLQFIPKKMSEKIAKNLGYQYGYLKDSLVEKIVSSDNWKSCLGPEKTVILMDTAQLFHRGKAPLSTDRFAVFFDYTSRYPKRPYYCKSSLPRAGMNLLAEQLSDQQKKALLWRDASQ
jgi:hypothetical protein